jgi:Na+-translocating ferredoxin:NAD+ oxidoreductase RnfC subunit
MRKLGIERYLDWEPKEVQDVTSKIKRVKLYLKQCTGQASGALVKEGDRVEEGQLIGQAVEGELLDFQCLSVNLHAPFSGVVKEVTKDYLVIER